jgi:anti-sigma factor RsiW
MMLRWFRRQSPDLACIEFVEVVTDYLEGTLSRVDRERFERHFAACPNCHRYLEQLLRTMQLTGELRTADVDALAPYAREELLAAFHDFRGE